MENIEIEFEVGEYVDYHGRTGRIIEIDKENKDYIVYFEDINEEMVIDKQELIEQNFY